MVARTLFFAPLLTGLADEIVAGMEAAGAAPYNSLHLRIEKDAKDWSTIMGGAGVRLPPQLCAACAKLLALSARFYPQSSEYDVRKEKYVVLNARILLPGNGRSLWIRLWHCAIGAVAGLCGSHARSRL